MSFASMKNHCFDISIDGETQCTASKFREELYEDLTQAKLKDALRTEGSEKVTFSFNRELSAAGKDYADAVSRLRTTDVHSRRWGDYIDRLFNEGSSDKLAEACDDAIKEREAIDEKQLVRDLETIKTSRNQLLKENRALSDDALPDFNLYPVKDFYNATSLKFRAFYHFKQLGVNDHASKYAEQLLPGIEQMHFENKAAIQSYLYERSLTINPAMQKRFGEIFDKLDSDGDGSVKETELKSFLRQSSNAADTHMMKTLQHHYDELPPLHDHNFLKKDEGISRQDMANLGGSSQDQPAKVLNTLKRVFSWNDPHSDSSSAAYFRVFSPGS